MEFLKISLSLFFVLFSFFYNKAILAGDGMEKQSFTIESIIEISKVPSSFPVGFHLLTNGNQQYVAYYDSDHKMVVASRTLDSKKWIYQILPSKVEWDSHNYITMAIDSEGQLHLSGNMHCVSLVYFRTTKPGDITTFKKIPKMVGPDENSCTYPLFVKNAENQLIFHYRSGGSGNGSEIYNIYNAKTGKWSRLLDKPLISGEGKRNAYMDGPRRGPDGYFHLCWVWRESADCSTNHDPSYARSKNLTDWENIKGEPLTLPITIKSPSVLIDPIPVNGGTLNGLLRVAFDSQNNILASYIKYDEKGNTQVYISKYQDSKWVSKQITKWDYRWNLKGNGSIEFGLTLGRIVPDKNGLLLMSFNHIKNGKGVLVIDEKTLDLVRTDPPKNDHPSELVEPESKFPGMKVKWAGDNGGTTEASVKYLLRWETLDSNRDQKRKGQLPEPSHLKLIKIVKIKN